MVRSLLLSTAIIVLTACATRVEDPVTTTVCAIAADPASFGDKRISVSANVRPGMHYEVFLSDPLCEKLIALDISDQYRDTIARDALLKAAFRDFPQDIQAPKATGTFIGVLRIHEGQVPRLSLQLESVRGLTAASSAPSNNSFKPNPLRRFVQMHRCSTAPTHRPARCGSA